MDAKVSVSGRPTFGPKPQTSVANSTADCMTTTSSASRLPSQAGQGKEDARRTAVKFERVQSIKDNQLAGL